ncbi:putative heat shock protein [Podospora aff. communis PSN243]|uniref:Heat shock protein n=1 Tax=Podospora aff. communis PSN243 TaxID=3040156 RepID=A0AAV9GVG3_9PEZI|nr:putative heat shock protein [Podospora aff. communis PSN243]
MRTYRTAITKPSSPLFSQASRRLTHRPIHHHRSISTKPILSNTNNMSLWNTRHNAPGFSSLFRMLDDFDRYAQGAMTETGGALRSFNPKFDITEHDKNYLLQGELPGVPRENVVIEFTDPQTLVIRGHAKHERTEGDPSMAPKKIEAGKEPAKIESGKGGETAVAAQEGEKKVEKKEDAKPKAKYWLSERSYGEFSRVFSFPTAVDQDGVQAKLEHGVLNITVPKVEKKGAKKIEIKL